MQVVVLRGASSIPFMLLPLIVMGRLSALKPVRIGMHMMRGVLMLLVLVAFVYAVRALSLCGRNIHGKYSAQFTGGCVSVEVVVGL